MLDQSSKTEALSIDSRHGYAMLLMVIGSIAISFGGLVQRNIEVATSWQINVYRSLGMLIAIALIIAIQNRGKVVATLLAVGRYGMLAGALLSVAGICFIQALTHTTVANALSLRRSPATRSPPDAGSAMD